MTDNGGTTSQGVGGIVGEWHGGVLSHVQSASGNTLWGVVELGGHRQPRRGAGVHGDTGL